jgi:hypothetical protein
VSIRYLLDEHIDHVVRRELLRREPDMEIKIIGGEDAPPRGTLDPDILLWLEEKEYLLVTKNRKTMPGHLVDHLNAGHHLPGILVLAPNVTLGRLIAELLDIWRDNRPDRFFDLLVYLPLSW